MHVHTCTNLREHVFAYSEHACLYACMHRMTSQKLTCSCLNSCILPVVSGRLPILEPRRAKPNRTEGGRRLLKSTRSAFIHNLKLYFFSFFSLSLSLSRSLPLSLSVFFVVFVCVLVSLICFPASEWMLGFRCNAR